MLEVSSLVRKAFYQALNGNLTFNSAPVPVSDDIKPVGNTSPIWVVLGSQTSSPKNTFNGWASDETIDLDIVYKTSTSSGKLQLDLIAGQILRIIWPTITTNGLPAQTGVQFLNVILSANRYIQLSLNSSNTVERRILTFKLYVAQL